MKRKRLREAWVWYYNGLQASIAWDTKEQAWRWARVRERPERLVLMREIRPRLRSKGKR